MFKATEVEGFGVCSGFVLSLAVGQHGLKLENAE